mgnify:CR=1 FL=1
MRGFLTTARARGMNGENWLLRKCSLIIGFIFIIVASKPHLSVSENYSKSLILEHCERSELRLFSNQRYLFLCALKRTKVHKWDIFDNFEKLSNIFIRDKTRLRTKLSQKLETLDSRSQQIRCTCLSRKSKLLHPHHLDFLEWSIHFWELHYRHTCLGPVRRNWRSWKQSFLCRGFGTSFWCRFSRFSHNKAHKSEKKWHQL